MCVIIVRPADHSLSMETLKSAQEANPHGWGIMTTAYSQVFTFRGMDWASFEAQYKRMGDAPLIIHFRWKTHGNIDIDNTHPYQVLSMDDAGVDLWMMHNGTIPIARTDISMSDTWHWVRDVAKPTLIQAPILLDIPAMRKLLEASINGSRIVFLDERGTITFLNRDKWIDKDGCQFSSQIRDRSLSPLRAGYEHWNGAYYSGKPASRYVAPVAAYGLPTKPRFTVPAVMAPKAAVPALVVASAPEADMSLEAEFTAALRELDDYIESTSRPLSLSSIEQTTEAPVELEEAPFAEPAESDALVEAVAGNGPSIELLRRMDEPTVTSMVRLFQDTALGFLKLFRN